MINRKLMAINDNNYDGILRSVLETTPNMFEAKKIVGRIYNETIGMLVKNENSIEDISLIFHKNSVKYGIV